MEETKRLPVIVSEQFLLDLDDIFSYGIEKFGISQAEKFERDIWLLVESLQQNYQIFPECRYLRTKTKEYRWIILESYSLVYRISKKNIKVLRMIHAKRSISQIKRVKKM